MKCKKCGFENVNGSEFCGNCGNRQDGLYEQQVSTSSNDKKNNKKKTILICSALVVAVLIVTIVFILSKSSKFEDPFEDVDDIDMINEIDSTRKYKETSSVANTLEDEFSENKITADKYIMQLAYSIYETDKLDYKYRNLELGTPNPVELLKEASKFADIISKETAQYIVEKYLLSDVKWNVDTENNTSGMTNNNFNNYEVVPLVSSDSDVSKLDEVVLSNNKHFLIYYTTSGKNSITKDDAKKIASELEKVVSSYEEKYGLKFQYNPKLEESFFGNVTETISFGKLPQATTKASKLLKNNSIDTKYLESSMPVYVIDTDAKNTGILGFYVPPVSGFMQMAAQVVAPSISVDTMSTTYAFPYFVVNSSLDNFENTKIILAHELFHHYQRYICGNNKYGECKSGLFTTETTANLVAAQNIDVNKTGSVLSNHSIWYVKEVSSSLDKVGLKEHGNKGLGYGAFIFAANYDEIVNKGYNHIFQSMKSENALKYIYDKSNEDYKKALLLTGERNLTLDYKNKLYIANKNKQYYPANYKDIGTSNGKINLKIDYSSMQYFYIDPNNYDEKSQIIFNANNDTLTLLLFIKEHGKYRKLYSHTLNTEFVINVSDFNLYNEVVFCVINSGITDSINYSIGVNQLGTKTATVTAKTLNLKTLEDKVKESSSFSCHQIEEDNEYKTISQIKLFFDKNALS